MNDLFYESNYRGRDKNSKDFKELKLIFLKQKPPKFGGFCFTIKAYALYSNLNRFFTLLLL